MFSSERSTLRPMKPSSCKRSAMLSQPVWLRLRILSGKYRVYVTNDLETTMPPSRKSEPEQLQFKAREVTQRRQSSSSLFRGLQTSRRTWRSSTKSERRTKDLLLRQLKPKLALKKQTSELTVEMSLRAHFWIWNNLSHGNVCKLTCPRCFSTKGVHTFPCAERKDVSFGHCFESSKFKSVTT